MPAGEDDPQVLARRLARERRARSQAEAIAEKATGDLFGALEELRELNEAMRDLVAMASHDLRSPLTVILGYTRILLQNWERLEEARQRDFVQSIEESARHLQRIVEDLLIVTRIEAGALQTRPQVVALRDAVQKVTVALGDHARDIVVTCTDELTVTADPDHLQRILVNFLTNALKYGAPPIEVRGAALGDWLEIRVLDRGRGVAPEFVPHLFRRFAREAAEDLPAQRGTGLGLWIVRGLAQANGGDVWYEPNDPSGAVFGVRIPARLAS